MVADMTQEEAEKLARELRPDDTDEGLGYDDFRALCDYILSGSMKREIENAAFERAAQVADKARDDSDKARHEWDDGSGSLGYERACDDIVDAIRFLIQPPAQKGRT